MKPIKFVEDKKVNWKRVSQLLETSAQENHWANFGPVSKMLEKRIAQEICLKDSQELVMCASGTAALHALVEMHHYFAHRELKWLVSSFGFPCTKQGPLRNAKVVDCNSEGMLDLHLLHEEDFDGMIVTNVFGLQSNLEKYREYCLARGKIFIGDCAMAFLSGQPCANEIISFHHTKPWGIGEGGCAIVEKDAKPIFSSLINFGFGMNDRIQENATNGKISDISCAFILQWLENFSEFLLLYRRQYRRIAKIAQGMGFRLLSGNENHPGVPSNVPLLAKAPLGHLENPFVHLRKYYKPLIDTPVAYDLYARIINVPCHPGLELLSDQEIEKVLHSLTARSETAKAA